MRWLHRHGYEGVSLDQLHAYLIAGEPLPPKPVVITFDDGYFDLLGLCLVLPLLNRWSSRFAEWTRRLHVPIAPLELGVLFTATYLVDKVTKLFLARPDMTYVNEEIREHIWAFLFLLLVIRWAARELQAGNRGEEHL